MQYKKSLDRQKAYHSWFVLILQYLLSNKGNPKSRREAIWWTDFTRDTPTIKGGGVVPSYPIIYDQCMLSSLFPPPLVDVEILIGMHEHEHVTNSPLCRTVLYIHKQAKASK